MANIDFLATSAIKRKKKAASHIGWPLVVIQAIEGSGIRHKPDINRLKPKVLARLREKGALRSKQRTT